MIIHLVNSCHQMNKLNHYCPVNFNEIPRFARNDKAFVRFAVGRGWVGGNTANPAPTNSF